MNRALPAAHGHLDAELAWWTAANDSFDIADAASAPQGEEVRIDPRELRNALGRFATGVCVVTTRAPDGRTAGLTVNSFSSVSLDPPLVAWCLVRKAPSLPAFLQAGHFAIHVMAHDQQALAMHFARPAPDKFEAVQDAFEPGLGDVPVLRDALARFECRKATVVEGGDHLIFLGRVERFAYADRPPLLFHAGRFLDRGAPTA